MGDEILHHADRFVVGANAKVSEDLDNALNERHMVIVVCLSLRNSTRKSTIRHCHVNFKILANSICIIRQISGPMGPYGRS